MTKVDKGIISANVTRGVQNNNEHFDNVLKVQNDQGNPQMKFQKQMEFYHGLKMACRFQDGKQEWT